jgi:hypothetical protein
MMMMFKQVLLMVLSLIIVLLDVSVSVASTYGFTPGSINTLPAVVYLVVFLATSLSSITVSVKMLKTLRRIHGVRMRGRQIASGKSTTADVTSREDAVSSLGKGVLTAVNTNVDPPPPHRPKSDGEPLRSSNKVAPAPGAGVVARAASGVKGKSPRTLSDRIAAKIQRALNFMIASGCLLLLLVVACAMMGSSLVYASPTSLGIVVMMGPLLEQMVSICDMRVISSTVADFGSTRKVVSNT